MKSNNQKCTNNSPKEQKKAALLIRTAYGHFCIAPESGDFWKRKCPVFLTASVHPTHQVLGTFFLFQKESSYLNGKAASREGRACSHLNPKAQVHWVFGNLNLTNTNKQSPCDPSPNGLHKCTLPHFTSLVLYVSPSSISSSTLLPSSLFLFSLSSLLRTTPVSIRLYPTRLADNPIQIPPHNTSLSGNEKVVFPHSAASLPNI